MKSKAVLVFSTTHMTLKAEEILKNRKIPNMVIPKPESAKSKCGMALRIYEEDLTRVKDLLRKENIKTFTVLNNEI
ncbi:MAG: DUF3343 domain-containing protein [Candidatus Schekmanbacteria bacterium]|nr:DUF3343 domain-containing protein [Candidatus Schekmanbacteria bacterium]